MKLASTLMGLAIFCNAAKAMKQKKKKKMMKPSPECFTVYEQGGGGFTYFPGPGPENLDVGSKVYFVDLPLTLKEDGSHPIGKISGHCDVIQVDPEFLVYCNHQGTVTGGKFEKGSTVTYEGVAFAVGVPDAATQTITGGSKSFAKKAGFVKITTPQNQGDTAFKHEICFEH
mmetsp:Transcript_31164/g.57588  ORF Transcript_31164/g.57588 Transcript_31164/m.57588 type:complete len:172 (-) Transcript_31164:185-700(-)